MQAFPRSHLSIIRRSSPSPLLFRALARRRIPMAYALLGFFVLLFFGFCYAVWKASPNWRWYQITPAVVLMLTSIFFVYPTAGVLKSRAAWHQAKEKLEKQAAELAVESRELRYGSDTDPTAPEGVLTLNRKLSKAGAEAGRRWGNLPMASVNNNQVVLNAPVDSATAAGIPESPASPSDAEGDVPPQPLIPEGLVVYGFAESLAADGQTALPSFYLGEYRITAASPTQVTLTPTGPLTEAQLGAINSGNASQWSVYELLPLDAHEPFVAEGSVRSEDNWLGRVDEEAVRALLGDNVSPETLQDYLRDGSRAVQDDPPLSRFVLIEFLEPYSEEVDAPGTRGALEGGFYDASGRAVDTRLQIPGDDPDSNRVSFDKGDQVLFKEEAADELIDNGTARLIDQYYLRPLNDYRYIIRHIRVRLAALANRAEEMLFEKAVLEEAIEKSNGMLVAGQQAKEKLEQDLAQFQAEARAIDAYTQEVRDQVESIRKTIRDLHRSNLTLEKRLSTMHRQIESNLEAVSELTAARR